MSLKFIAIISLMSVFVALVSCDIVINTLEASYKDANSVLSVHQKEFLSQFKGEAESAGVDMIIDNEFVVPKDGFQKAISTLLVKKHGKYSPDSKNPNGLAQFHRDYLVFVEGPCDAARKDVFTAVTALYVGAAFNQKYFDLVKAQPSLYDWVQKSRLCFELFGKTEKLVNSSYEYMVSRK